MSKERERAKAEYEYLKLQEEEEELKSALPIGIDEPSGQTPKEALGLMEAATNTLDAFGAPVRSQLHGMAEEGTPFTTKGIREFGTDVFTKGLGTAISEAPSGKETMAKLGLSTDETIDLGVTKVSPAGLVGLPYEMATDPLSWLPAKKALEPMKAAFKSGKIKQAAKVISRRVTKSKYLKSGVDPEVLALQALSDELQKELIKGPKALYKKLRGSKPIKRLESGKVVGYKQGARSKGYIDEVQSITDDVVTQVNDKLRVFPYARVQANEVRDVAFSKFKSRISAQDEFGGEAVESTYLKIQESLLGESVDLAETAIGKPSSLKDLHELRKGWNAKLSGPDYKVDIPELRTQKQVLRDLIDASDDILKEKMGGVRLNIGGDIVDAAEMYSANNARTSNLIKLAETMEDAGLENLKQDDLIAIIRGMTATGTAGGVIGSGLGMGSGGILLGGGFKAANEVGKQAAKTAPEASMKWFDRLERGITPMSKTVPQIQRSLTQPDRSPDSLGRAPNSIGRRADDAAKMIANTPLPRDSQWMLDNAQEVLLKVAQVMPESYDQVQDLLVNQKHNVPFVFPMLVNMMPQLFEPDKYNRIDGKIMEPHLLKKAERDLWASPEYAHLSIAEKVELNDAMNIDGSFPL